MKFFWHPVYSFVNGYDMVSKKEKLCLECEASIVGRIDKKFCSDGCRIAFNNKLNSDDINLVRNINNILRRNRRILISLNPKGKSRVYRDKLKALGFNFNYYTSAYTTKEGAQYFYCYEQGYLTLEKDQCLLVIKKIAE